MERHYLTLSRRADDRYVRSLRVPAPAATCFKQSASSELIPAIRAVAAGDNYIDPN